MPDKQPKAEAAEGGNSPSSRRYAVESAIAIAKDRSRPWKILREKARYRIPPWDVCTSTSGPLTVDDECNRTPENRSE